MPKQIKESKAQKDVRSERVNWHCALHSKATQLNAMLAIIYGGGGESFHEYANHIKDDYLMTCYDLAAGIKKLAENYPT